MARWGSMIAVGALCVLAACSSDGDAGPGDTTIATTTAPANTEAPTTTTTTTPPTTQPPTTTIDPAVAVTEDLLRALQLGRVALMDPFDSNNEIAALDLRLGVIRENLERTLADYRERNLALRENPDVPASVVVEGSPVFLGATGEVAEVRVCEINSWILVEVGAGPDGGDAVVDPEVVTYRNEFFVRYVDGAWRIEGGNELASYEGAVECAAD